MSKGFPFGVIPPLLCFLAQLNVKQRPTFSSISIGVYSNYVIRTIRYKINLAALYAVVRKKLAKFKC